MAAGLAAGGAFALFGSGSSSLSDPVAEAATVSSAAAGFRMHMSLELSSSAFPTTFTGSGDGSFDLRDHTGQMSMSLNLGDIPQLTQALGGGSLRMNEVLDGTTVYMKMPAPLSSSLGAAGGKWIKMDLAKVAHLPGLSSLGSSPVTNDPRQTLEFLRGLSSGVTVDGRQVVDGFQTTHYHADLDLDRVAGEVPSADQAAAQQAVAMLEKSLPVHTIPVDVWVDSSHLVRRVHESVAAPLPNGQKMSVAVTIDVTDYGPQPRPAVPPASDVTDLSGLATTLGGQ